MLGGEMATMRPKLYVLPASHPCAAVEAAFKLKSIDYERVDLLPLTQLLVGPFRYGGNTVPGMRYNEERVVGSRAIMRRLDALAPEPPLLPPVGDPAYARVLEAERWGDEVFQDATRRMIVATLQRRPAAMESYVGDAKLPLPAGMRRPALPLTARLMGIRSGAKDEPARADLAALPAQLERIDAFIADGVLGGPQPNAADLQIGSAIRLLLSVGDIRPLIEGHPAAELARYFPALTGSVEPGVLPAQWLPASIGA
jgi:glutathione S-transferase